MNQNTEKLLNTMKALGATMATVHHDFHTFEFVVTLCVAEGFSPVQLIMGYKEMKEVASAQEFDFFDAWRRVMAPEKVGAVNMDHDVRLIVMKS